MENTTGNIYALIPRIMAKIGHISKDRKNQQQGYAYRGIDDLYAALQGPLSEHGVFIAPTVKDKSDDWDQADVAKLHAAIESWRP